ncbi:MAG: 4-hydroxy-tetrahydrodipicolinate synthase [Synergistaceae bacterium]|nr:4-hydroxy-tetrahydrodipicolinate synthase [Synergistaceae bacterium]
MFFKGTGTAIVTPFNENGIDYENFSRFIDWQIEQKVEFLLVLGTTGESPTVLGSEREELIKFFIKKVDKRVPVVVGTSSNSTAVTVENSAHAQKLGADGVLVVTPYYNKPTQEGLYQHFKTVAEAIEIPLIIYNVPSRTGSNILPETVLRLAEFKNIAAVKEASGIEAQVDELLRKMPAVRSDFSVLSGNDDQAFHLVNAGGHGVISVLSNIAPLATSNMIREALAGNVVKARELHLKLFPLMKNLFMETNPIPVKYGACKLGFCKNILRLPLVPASEKCCKQIDNDMKECGLI